MQSPTSEFVNQISRAGAGAGKTTQLTLKVIELVRERIKLGEEAPRLVVTTFTRKATQELRERLVAKALELREPALVTYMNSRSQLHISTIHGVLALFLSRYGHLIGLDAQFRFQSDLSSRRLIKRAMREALLKSESSSLLLETYKYEELEQMALDYHEKWMSSSGLSFVTDAELRSERDKKIALLSKKCSLVSTLIVSETSSEPWQKWSEQLLTLGSIFKTWSNEGSSRLEIALEDGGTLSAKMKKEVSSSTLDQMLELREEIKDFSEDDCYKDLFINEHQKMANAFSDFGFEFTQSLFNLKMSASTLSMSDLEGLALQVLLKFPEAGEGFSKEWDYWLIDEYQDTSPLQVRLLKSLVGKANQYIVGDPQQSIYLFRGARTEVFLEKEKDMASLGGVFKPLMKNYRSEKPLLEFFNDYFSKVSPQFSKMEAAGPDGKNAIETHPSATVLICDPTETTEGIDCEVSAVVYRVQELLKQGAVPEDIAILGRKNKDLVLIAEKAMQVGIPVQLHSSAQFYKRREIKDALALLKFFVNPHDNLNLLVLLRSPWLRVPDQLIAEACKKHEFSYWKELLKLNEPAIERLKDLLMRSKSQSVSHLWLDHLVELGFFDSCGLHDSSGKREANLWKMVFSLFSQERQKGFSYNAFLEEAKWAAKSGSSDESDAVPVVESKRINLMTVHSSKGLQFKHVILPFFGKGKSGRDDSIVQFDSAETKWSLKIPNSEEKKEMSLIAKDWRDEFSLREKEESDRVLYVAMTRAQESVSLIWGEKVEKNSWASAFPYSLNEGLQNKGLFSLEVKKGQFEPEVMLQKKIESSQIRPLWKKEAAVAALEASSFSEKNQLDIKEFSSKAFVNLVQSSHRGIFMHKVMEAVKFSGEKDLKKWIVKEVPDKDVEKTKQALDFILTLKNLNLSAVIANGFAEWGFTYSENGQRIQGQIDLWGRDETGRLWVIDYKTGSPEFEAKAFEQLESYVKALKICKKTKPGEQVARAVIYPFDKRVSIVS